MPGACQFRLAIAQLNKIVAHQGIGGVAGRRLRKHCHRVVKLPSLFVSARGTAIKIGAEAGKFRKVLSNDLMASSRCPASYCPCAESRKGTKLSDHRRAGCGPSRGGGASAAGGVEGGSDWSARTKACFLHGGAVRPRFPIHLWEYAHHTRPPRRPRLLLTQEHREPESIPKRSLHIRKRGHSSYAQNGAGGKSDLL